MADKPNQDATTMSQPVTALSGVKSLEHLKRFYTVPDFKIGGVYEVGNPAQYEFGAPDGATLESLGAGPLRTAYIATGSPERDDEGRIANAVIINCYIWGDSALFYYWWHEGQKGNDFSAGPVVGPGRIIDTDRYYVIFLDALGLWGASKPSDGLGMKFPQYSPFDYVQANYRLLKDELNIGKVKLATGVSMGAIQSYVWALLHPEYVEAIMPIGGSTSTRNDSVLRWNSDLMNAAMMSDPVWRETQGDYYHLPKEKHPNQGLMFGWSIVMHTGIDLDYRLSQGWDEVKKEVFYWEPKDDEGSMLREKAREYDVNDLLLRNGWQEKYDIDEYLSSINTPTLIMHVETDLWLRICLAKESAKRIPGARFASFSDPMAHYAVFKAPNTLKEEALRFFKEIGMK